MGNGIAQLIKTAVRKRLLFLPHAVKQMSRPERMISAQEVRRVVLHGEIVEDYPEDARGHSCLIVGQDDEGRLIYVVCAPKLQYLAVEPRTCPRQVSGDRISKQGGKSELHSLPRDDEEVSRAISYRSQRLSSIARNRASLGLFAVR